MSFRESLTNIKYFFKWMGELISTWFAPYHYDEEDEEKASAAENAPDSSPKPSPPPAGETEATDGSVAYGEPFDSGETSPSPDLSEIMAFRGAMTQTAMAAVMGKSRDDLTLEVESLLDYSMIEDIGDGRYLLLEHERRRILRADSNFADWLSRFQHNELEEGTLEVLEQLCRQLPVKIMAGKVLVIHLRQRKWMIWQSGEEVCRVKVFGTLSKDEWSHLRELDGRARRYRRRKDRRGWNPNDWVSFRWVVGSDSLAIESVLLEAGRTFQKNVRRRRKTRPRRQPSEASSESGPR